VLIAIYVTASRKNNTTAFLWCQYPGNSRVSTENGKGCTCVLKFSIRIFDPYFLSICRLASNISPLFQDYPFSNKPDYRKHT